MDLTKLIKKKVDLKISELVNNNLNLTQTTLKELDIKIVSINGLDENQEEYEEVLKKLGFQSVSQGGETHFYRKIPVSIIAKSIHSQTEDKHYDTIYRDIENLIESKIESLID